MTSKKIAVLQVADTGPLESLYMMLSAAGYHCLVPGESLRRNLLSIGCDTVVSIGQLVANMGYSPPIPQFDEAAIGDMTRADLYVDVKAHRNGPKIWPYWPNLKDKTLWYRINGSEPEHVIRGNGEDMGDERNPPCPVLTPNRWYKEDGPWSNKSYCFWPSFMRITHYDLPRKPVDPPVTLIHNLGGWGYGLLGAKLFRHGVRLYGKGSPSGLVTNAETPSLLARAKAMIHLKSNDAPGYALYEALSARCPLIVPRRLIWRSHMEELFVEDETCLCFDRPTHDALTDKTAEECFQEIKRHLRKLEDFEYSCFLAHAACRRLHELMWRPDRDLDSFKDFLARMYGNVPSN